MEEGGEMADDEKCGHLFVLLHGEFPQERVRQDSHVAWSWQELFPAGWLALVCDLCLQRKLTFI
jgi:hypothetical protein